MDHIHILNIVHTFNIILILQYFTYPRRGTILNTREFCVPMYLPMVLKNIPVKSVFSVSFYLGSGDSGNHCTA